MSQIEPLFLRPPFLGTHLVSRAPERGAIVAGMLGRDARQGQEVRAQEGVHARWLVQERCVRINMPKARAPRLWRGAFASGPKRTHRAQPPRRRRARNSDGQLSLSLRQNLEERMLRGEKIPNPFK